MRKLLIDDAPAKELIEQIRSTGDPEALRVFIKTRLDWNEYPIIHDGIVSYSIFEDLNFISLRDDVVEIIFNYLLDTLATDLSDNEFSAWVFLLNALKVRKTFKSQSDCEMILHGLTSAEDRVCRLKDNDRSLSTWYYNLRNVVLFELVKQSTYDEYNGKDDFPAECETRIRESYDGTLIFEKRIAYHGGIYWIWRGQREPNAPKWTPVYLSAIVKDPSGDFLCYSYTTSPAFNVPAEAIVKRIEGTYFQTGGLDELK